MSDLDSKDVQKGVESGVLRFLTNNFQGLKYFSFVEILKEGIALGFKQFLEANKEAVLKKIAEKR